MSSDLFASRRHCCLGWHGNRLISRWWGHVSAPWVSPHRRQPSTTLLVCHYCGFHHRHRVLPSPSLSCIVADTLRLGKILRFFFVSYALLIPLYLGYRCLSVNLWLGGLRLHWFGSLEAFSSQGTLWVKLFGLNFDYHVIGIKPRGLI